MMRVLQRACVRLSCDLLTAERTRSRSCVGFVRFKYAQYKGVKGIRNRKSQFETKAKPLLEGTVAAEAAEDTLADLEDSEYDAVATDAMHVSRKLTVAQSVLVIQPYVKWGPKRIANVSPDEQLQEAEALVRSLPNWRVATSLKVPLESLESKTLFGSGKMEELKTIVQQERERNSLTRVFVSKGTLSFAQKCFLEAAFSLPVMDRYSVVIQILRLHATSAESRLQVAMAELPYIWSQVKDASVARFVKGGGGYTLSDSQRDILKGRERKLKSELERIRGHRKLLRNKRKQHNYPVVAVVGYTNCGKTSLIKALTQESGMQPRDQLFATLDVTAHAGMLPCNLEVLFIDTVGFMSDLPTGLIECFIATLEDAMLADIILHIQDVSHSCYAAQKQHVETTLQSLLKNMCSSEALCLPPVIDVGNKIDLLPSAGHLEHLEEQYIHLVSAKEGTGLPQLLQDIESKLLAVTGRRKIVIRVRNGGSEMAWLHKHAAVVKMRADTKDPEYMLMDVVIMKSVMQQFQHLFCQQLQ